MHRCTIGIKFEGNMFAEQSCAIDSTPFDPKVFAKYSDRLAIRGFPRWLGRYWVEIVDFTRRGDNTDDPVDGVGVDPNNVSMYFEPLECHPASSDDYLNILIMGCEDYFEAFVAERGYEG